MMHDPNRHPDDERLSALAGDDPEASADQALMTHLAGCERCRSFVGELTALRGALASLPDMTPPRPLRLLPPVPEPRPATTAGVLRRLFAPALAAGILLSVVGGVGSFGTLLSGMGASAGAPAEVAQPATNQDTVSGGANRAPEGSFQPVDGGRAYGRNDAARGVTVPALAGVELPIWPVVLAVGLELVAMALVLRHAVQPRAG